MSPVTESDTPIRLDDSMRKRAAELLASAFHEDPLFRAVLPEEDPRRRASLWLHDKVLRYCSLYGTTHTLPSIPGVACWLHPGQTGLSVGRIVRSGLLAMPLRMGPAAFARFFAYTNYSSEMRRRNTPDSYWYLWALAVDPSHQGKGIGGRLIRPVLQRADASGTACYLETEEEKNLVFYERHGFRVAAEGRVPRLGLPTWSMIREPV
jgi:ribosomal protein S18 acetylase RimI-like enzyme